MHLNPSFNRAICAIWRTFLACLLVSSLGACALSPKQPQAQKQSHALLQAQLNHIGQQLSQAPADKIKHIYLGSAQHSQSLVFQRDILSMETSLKTINPATASILLSNQLETQQLQYPFATQPHLEEVFNKLSGWSHQYPLSLTVLISTHGAPDILSINIANQYLPPVRTAHLKPWLDRLHPRTKVTVVLSACYSGSFADALRGDNRIVLTAAAPDRNSFGCSYNEKNTWFIGQLLGPHFAPQTSWGDVFTATRSGVEQLEKTQKMNPPSNPQIRSTEPLKKMTLGEWFSS